jgi:hypothetical protein
MSFEENPFSGPEAPAAALETAGGAQLSGTMIASLEKTSPWVRYLAILGFIGSGFTVIMGVIFLLGGGAFLTQAFSDSDNVALAAAAGASAAIGVIYIGMGLLSFLPSFFLYSYGAKLRNYSLTLNNDELEGAFRYNRSFWKFCGILSIIFISLTVLAFPILIIIAIAAGTLG